MFIQLSAPESLKYLGSILLLLQPFTLLVLDLNDSCPVESSNPKQKSNELIGVEVSNVRV